MTIFVGSLENHESNSHSTPYNGKFASINLMREHLNFRSFVNATDVGVRTHRNGADYFNNHT